MLGNCARFKATPDPCHPGLRHGVPLADNLPTSAHMARDSDAHGNQSNAPDH